MVINAYQHMGLLKSAGLAEIETAYALKSYWQADNKQYTEATTILRDNALRAKLNVITPFYLPENWTIAEINCLDESKLILDNLHGKFKPKESELAWLNMLSGTAYYYLEEFSLALENYLKAEVSLLTDRHLHFNLALTYTKLTQTEKASAYFKNSLPLLDYLELGLCYQTFSLNREDLAELLLSTKAVDSKAYWEVLEILIKEQNLSLAEQVWQKAAKEHPDNLDLQFYVLQICLAEADFTKATTYFHHLNSKFSSSKPAREAARLLTKMGLDWYYNFWHLQEYVTAIKILGQVASINREYEKLLAESVTAFLRSQPKNADKLKIEPEILKAKSFCNLYKNHLTGNTGFTK